MPHPAPMNPWPAHPSNRDGRMPGFSAVVLAGGQSRRMGRDKAWLPIEGRPLLERQVVMLRSLGPGAVLVSGRPDTDYTALGCQVVLDRRPSCGPLGGIEAALAASQAPLVLVVAVDMPGLTAAWLRAMVLQAKPGCGVVPRFRGRAEPLAAVYPREALPVLESMLQAGSFAATDFAEACARLGLVMFIDAPPEDEGPFANWNAPTDVVLGRKIDYMRISVTDRCDERCLYCMPEGYKGWARRPDHLTAEEIIRVARVAAGMGFRKFRLTGGEPLIRADLPEIVRGIASTPGVETVGLSTNGLGLARLAGPLREAGARTVNVSLDALDPEVYRRITGGDVERVLAGVRSAIEAGFECVKLNAVLLRGLNEEQVWPLVLFAAEHGLPLRFIELMPMSQPEAFIEKHFLPVTQVQALIGARDRLLPRPDTRIGHGPAKYYRLERTGALVGFIGPLTEQHFCESCNRVRLTADGQVRPCLGQHGQVDLRERLRGGDDDATLASWLMQAIRQKPEHHGFHEGYEPCRPMTAVGG